MTARTASAGALSLEADRIVNLTRRAIGTVTIGRKLSVSFGIVVAITLLIAFVGYINNAILSSTVERVVVSTSIRQALAGEISRDFGELLSLERGMNLRILTRDSVNVEAHNREFLIASDRLSAHLDQLAPQLVSESDRQLCSQLITVNFQLRHLHDLSYMMVSNGALSTAPNLPAEAYKVHKEQFLPQAMLAKTQAAHLLEDQEALIQQESLGAHRTEVRSRYLTLFMLVLFFIVGGVLTRIVISSARSLRRITASLGQGASQIAAAALQVSTSSQSLARGASEQAAFTEQTSDSAEDIAAMARRNTSNAQTTAGMVAQSQCFILEGNQALDQMVSAMDGIAASSRQISKIVKLIDQIAFQTNILALNAAVEAARAGESGLSFSVVADEIRALSQRTAQAAKDTAQLIDDCIARSETGKLKVDEVAAAIRSITAESAKVKLLVDEIYAGSREQSHGIDQISKAVLQIEQVTQGTAAGVEQSAAAAAQLNTQFQTLKEIARDLAVMLGTAIPDEPKAAAELTKPHRVAATHEVLPDPVHESETELQPL